jgi:UDP-N-acetylmuramyl pentapeptide phosphotransferase/UDP-N-acetylglucosamine-1-phosphate transferase
MDNAKRELQPWRIDHLLSIIIPVLLLANLQNVYILLMLLLQYGCLIGFLEIILKFSKKINRDFAGNLKSLHR